MDPVQALGNLSTPCASTGACDSSSPWTLPVQYVTPSDFMEIDDTLSMTATCHYPPDQYDQFLQAVTTAVSAPSPVQWSRGVTIDSGDINRRDTGPEDDPGDTITHGPVGSYDVAKFSNFVSMSVFNGIDMVGSIDATMTLASNADSFYKSVVGVG